MASYRRISRVLRENNQEAVEQNEVRKNVKSTFHERKINEKNVFSRIVKGKVGRCLVAGAVSRHEAEM